MAVTAAASTWQLRRAPKYAAHGVVRTVPPAETIERVTPLMPVIGVTVSVAAVLVTVPAQFEMITR